MFSDWCPCRLPDAQVQALRAAQLGEEETCEEGEKPVNLYKKIKFKTVKDKENTRVNEQLKAF